MQPAVPARIRIRSKLPPQVHLKPRLFQGLSSGRILQALAVINEATRQRPAMWRILSLYEHDSLSYAIQTNNDIHCGNGVPGMVLPAGFSGPTDGER